jgi:hypothetical protein
MANLLISPASAIISFSNDSAGSSTFPSLTASSRLVFDNFGGLNIVSKVPTTSSTNRMSIEGRSGIIYSVTEETTGTLLSINDVAGLPIFEVRSDANDTITMGTVNTNTFVVVNSTVNVGCNVPILNNARFSVSGIAAVSNQIVFQGTNNSTTPTSGNVALFAKTDNKIYAKTADGIESDLTSIANQSWSAYNVEWTAAGGTSPVIGDGTLLGRCRKIGKTVFVNIKWSAGSTTTYGSPGQVWRFSLPFSAVNPDAILLNAALLDNGFGWYQGTGVGTYAGLTDKFSIIVNNNTGATSIPVMSGTPVVWNAGDAIIVGGSYESV